MMCYLVSLVALYSCLVCYCEPVISAEMAVTSMCSCHIGTASLSCVLLQLQQLSLDANAMNFSFFFCAGNNRCSR